MSAQKRRYIADFSKQFGEPSKAIKENPGTDNRGPMLDKWIKANSVWSPGNPWCAGFVSAMATLTDKNVSAGPTSKYNSMSSQCGGAGRYSNNPRDAQVGLAVSWKNSDGSGGHVGLVVAVTSNGIVVAEGNTNNSAVQERNGGETAVKTYSWDKIKQPASGRYFNGYFKIWPEDNSTIGNPSNLPPSSNVAAVDGMSTVSDGYGGTSGYISGPSTPPGKTYEQFFSELNGGVTTSESIANVSKNDELSKNGTEKANEFSEAKTVSNPTAKLDKMSLSKESNS